MPERMIPQWTHAKGDIWHKDYTWYLRMMATERGYWSVMASYEDGAKRIGGGKAGKGQRGNLAKAQQAAEKCAEAFRRREGGMWDNN